MKDQAPTTASQVVGSDGNDVLGNEDLKAEWNCKALILKNKTNTVMVRSHVRSSEIVKKTSAQGL